MNKYNILCLPLNYIKLYKLKQSSNSLVTGIVSVWLNEALDFSEVSISIGTKGCVDSSEIFVGDISEISLELVVEGGLRNEALTFNVEHDSSNAFSADSVKSLWGVLSNINELIDSIGGILISVDLWVPSIETWHVEINIESISQFLDLVLKAWSSVAITAMLVDGMWMKMIEVSFME